MKIALLVNLGLITMSAVGARLGMTATPYVLIGAICIISFLIAKDWIKPKYYPVYIFGMSLCMLWQVSMMGVFVVGSDINLEYYISSLALQSGEAWGYPHQYSTSIVVTLLAPWISRISGIELVWVYKAVFPIFLACVPPIMYFAFKKQFGEKRAYWAALFFMIVPVISLEIIGIAKAMVAELFFALAILTLVSDLKQRYKGVVLPILVTLALVCHYTVGGILMGFLIACLSLRLAGKLWKAKGRVSLAVLSLAILLPCVAGYFYFSTVNDGKMINTMMRVTRMTTVNVVQNARDMSIVATESGRDISFYVNQQSGMVRAGIGLDFMSVPIEGKIFRVVQYSTQLLIVLGLVRLWKRRKEYSFTLEFVACILAGFALLGACIFIPFFSNILNMTRYYHMSLFFLAPLFILGCELVWNKRWFIPCILLIYFMFTSGLIFEVIQSTAIEKVSLPYSLSLSSERTGIGGVYNKDDLACAEWLVNESNPKAFILTDVNTKRLLQCFTERDLRTCYEERYYAVRIYRPWTLQEIPDGDCYVFLSTWNVEHSKLLHYDASFNVGMRKVQNIPDDIYDLPVAYQSGKSVVYLMEVE